MRKPLALLGATLLAAALTACSGGGTPGTTSAAADDTLNLAFLGGVKAPDPDTAYDGPELNLVNSAYEGLVAYKSGQDKPELEPALATKWTANADNTQFTFDLRTGVTFHDGTPFTADAVEASFKRRTDVGEGPSYMVSDVKSVEKKSDSQVVVTLSGSNSAFLDLLASPFGPKMVSPAAIEAHPYSAEGENWWATHEAGTGPYTYGTFTADTSYQLKAYDKYWGDKPGYPTVDFAVVSSLSTIQLQLESGELDGLAGYADNATYTALQGKDTLNSYTFPSMQTPTLFVNPKSAAVGSEDVRKKLLAGIDFTDLTTKALGSIAKPTTEVFPVNLLSDPGLDQQKITHDGGALAALAAGPLSGKTIKIAYGQTSADAKNLSDNLAATLNAAGIKAQSTGYALGTYFPELEKGASGPDLTFFAGFPDTAHPDAWATVFYTPKGGLDLFGAEVPGLADLLTRARSTDDEQLYSQASALVSESGYFYSVATSLGTANFAKKVAGVEQSWNPVITGVLDLAVLRPAS
ncbi:ABC transporter substrate-binding protein [Actinoplanes sp. RD1]|uniref:ABC transporter substrate-binding protein n=1 Tax=Actinoplanes sp. RD1 TaxID=3064538 RepID=UPI0027413E5A|nr:ABC transporter substrate-binding protein [Actinoplanes sp. RD1]